MKKINIFMLCVSALQLSLRAENEVNEVNLTLSKIAKKLAMLQQLTAEEVYGIRFTFEISRRKEFDQNLWQQTVAPVLTHMNEITKKDSSQSLNKILLVAKNIYAIAKESDSIEGKMSLTLAHSLDLIRVKYEESITTENATPSNIHQIKLIFELSRDEIGYDLNIWQKAVEIGAKTAKEILEDGNNQNVDTVCDAMEKIYTILNGTPWAHATTRIVLKSKEIDDNQSKSCDQQNDDQTRSVDSYKKDDDQADLVDSGDEDDDPTRSVDKDLDVEDSDYRIPCDKCNRSLPIDLDNQKQENIECSSTCTENWIYEEAEIKALEKDWKDVMNDEIDKRADDEKYFFNDNSM